MHRMVNRMRAAREASRGPSSCSPSCASCPNAVAVAVAVAVAAAALELTHYGRATAVAGWVCVPARRGARPPVIPARPSFPRTRGSRARHPRGRGDPGLVIPTDAGIQGRALVCLDPRFRGDDGGADVLLRSLPPAPW